MKQKNKKEFISFKTRPIRMSDEVWEKFKKKKNKSGLSWNQFISNLIK